MCAFGGHLVYRATSTSIASGTTSGTGNENESGIVTPSSQSARAPAHKISILCVTLTAAHDDLGLCPSTPTSTVTVIPTWIKTSIWSPYPSACVLCSCERGMPCARRLHSGDMSPCGTADCGGATENAGVSAPGRLVGGLGTFSRAVDPWTCGAGGREPCSSSRQGRTL